MFKTRKIAFVTVLSVLTILSNAYGQMQPPAAPNADASVESQAAVPGASTPEPVTSTLAPATSTPEPVAPAQNAPVNPAAPVQNAAVSTQTVPNQQPQVIVIQQPAAPAEKPSSLFNSQTIFNVLMLIIIATLIASLFGRRHVAEFGEEEKSNESVNDEKLPFNGASGILNGERFKPGSEFSQEALNEAKRQASDFIAKLDDKLVSSKNTIVPQHELQIVADSVQDNMLKRICRSDSFWMKKIWFDSTPPNADELRNYVNSLLVPVQVPEGSEIQLTPSPWRVGILAVIGALLGMFALNKPLEMCQFQDHALLSLLIGAGLITSGAFWIVSNKARRETAMIGIGVGLALGWLCYGLLELPKYIVKRGFGGVWFDKLVKWSHLDTRNNSKLLETLKSTTFWGFVVILVLEFLKFPINFDKQGYEKKLEGLYYERVQAIVMLLASLKYNRETVEQKWSKETDRLNAVIEEKDKQIIALIQGQEGLVKVYERYRDIHNCDIRDLDNVLVEIQQQFQTYRFNEDTDIDEAPCMIQLKELLKKHGDELGFVTYKIPEFVWNEEEHSSKYRKYGIVRSGDTVIELEKSVIQNGVVEKQGVVKRKPQES